LEGDGECAAATELGMVGAMTVVAMAVALALARRWRWRCRWQWGRRG
jgi:uncharacterized protein (TIGR03382 family)